MTRTEYLDFLIREFTYFNEKEEEDFHEGYPRDVINLLVFEKIRQFKAFGGIELKKEDFDKLSFEEKVEILQKSKEINQTVSSNLEVLEEFVKETETRKTSGQQTSVEEDIARLRAQVNQIRQKTPVAGEFIKDKTSITIDFNDLEDSTVNVIWYADIPEEKVQEVPRYINNLKGSGATSINTNIVSQELGNNASKGIISGFVLSPIEQTLIPLAVSIGSKAAAKEDPISATAKEFYYIQGITKPVFETLAKEAGLTSNQTKKFGDYLQTFQNAHPDFAIILASQKAGINANQVQQIFQGQNIYENYTKIAPPITGWRGFVSRVSQQVGLGPRASNYVDSSIRRGLQNNAAKGESFIAKKISGNLIGNIIKGGGWLLSKVSLGINTNSGKILTGGGAIGGFIVGGPIGAIGGGVLGATAGGADWGKIYKTIAIITGVVFSALMSAIAIPLVISLIMVPLIVVFILFIINSGAYVVPPSSGTFFIGQQASTAGPGCPSGWPVDTSQGQTYFVNQGPGGPVTHGPPLYPFAEAIDIHPTVGDVVSPKFIIRATHSGTVRMGIGADPLGHGPDHFVVIYGTCNGKPFSTTYAHLTDFDPNLKNGESITPGTALGIMGRKGYAAQVHLHYEFTNANGYAKVRQEPNNPPYMYPPYLPKVVKLYCVYTNNKGGNIPCDTIIP